MHILAGKYRRQRLLSYSSPKVRPTARRLREALFAALDAKILGARFLDLCAGSGSVGLEALSRGAARATFVECSPRFASRLDANLQACGISDAEAEVMVDDAAAFLLRAVRRRLRWDVVFYDPPYQTDYTPVLTLLTRRRLIQCGGVVIVEHEAARTLPDSMGRLVLWQRICFGASGLSLYHTATGAQTRKTPMA